MTDKIIIQQAQRFLAAGKVTAAAELASQVLQSNPEHFDAQLIQARCGALSGYHMTFSPALSR